MLGRMGNSPQRDRWYLLERGIVGGEPRYGSSPTMNRVAVHSGAWRSLVARLHGVQGVSLVSDCVCLGYEILVTIR